MYDLIIVGGGPAGLTAAVYALRKRLNVLLVSKDLGGKTNFHLELPWIENYQVIRGLEIVNKFKSEVQYLDFARHLEPVESITHHKQEDGYSFTVHTRGGGELKARAVIVATGVQQQRLDVPGEKDYIMRGLCYSALSYAPLFIDRETVVYGDGDLAFRAAAELATVAKHVNLIRSTSATPDSPLFEKLKQTPHVTIIEGSRVTAIRGDEYAREVFIMDEDGKERSIASEGAFIELNLIPNTALVEGLAELDEQGRIIINNKNQTNVPGLFAAGDVANTYAEQVLVAIGEGAKAALSAYEYLLPIL
jgi:NADH-dependent peroxiredoxin subunit F